MEALAGPKGALAVRAVRFDGQSVAFAADAREPEAAPGEALVHPTRVLVTPADAHAVSAAGAARSRFAGVVGSHFVGVVKKINLPADAGPVLSARKDLVGKRVVGSPTIACAQCDLCRAGLPMHCRARKVAGAHGRDGCLADLFAMPLASLHAVPQGVDDDRAVFAPMLASALQASAMLRAASKHYITVLGESALALLTAQVLARQNKTVRLLTSRGREDRGRLLEAWGIKHRMIDEPGRRQDQDAVVDCTGAASGLRLALQFVRARGVILLKSPVALAPYPAGQPFAEASAAWAEGVDLTPVVANEVQIMGCRDGPIPDALGVLSEGTMDVLSLISKRARLEEGPAAFEAAGRGEHTGVLIDV